MLLYQSKSRSLSTRLVSTDVKATIPLLAIGPLHLVAAIFVSAGTALASASSPALCRRGGASCLLRGAGTTVLAAFALAGEPFRKKIIF